MGLPFFAYVVRREPNRPMLLPERFNGRVTEQIAPDESPDPVRQSDVWAFGKPIEHALSRQTIAITGIAPDAYHAVMADNFATIGHVGYQVSMGDRPGAVIGGGQMPYRERISIVRNPPQSYGSGFILDPTLAMGIQP